MKTNKKVLSVIAGIFLMSSAIYAQSAAEEHKPTEDRCTKELILGVPKVSEKNLFVLTETAPKIKGVKYIDFCENDKLLLLKYDQEIYPKPEDVIKAFQSQNILMPMLIKQGRFDDVKEMCGKN